MSLTHRSLGEKCADQLGKVPLVKRLDGRTGVGALQNVLNLVCLPSIHGNEKGCLRANGLSTNLATEAERFLFGFPSIGNHEGYGRTRQMIEVGRGDCVDGPGVEILADDLGVSGIDVDEKGALFHRVLSLTAFPYREKRSLRQFPGTRRGPSHVADGERLLKGSIVERLYIFSVG